MVNSLFKRFMIKFKYNLPDTKFIEGESPGAALTIPAKHPATGNINIWDDGVELTIGIGEYFHCHYDPANFLYGGISQEQAEKQCIDSAISFVSEFLSDKSILHVRFSDDIASESGIVKIQYADSIPVDAKRFVWSGPID